MYNGKYVSSSSIIEKIYRDFAFDITIQYESLIEWVGESLSELKVPVFYQQKITDGNKDLNHQDYIIIKDGRGKLPCDLYQIRQCAAVLQYHGKCNNKQAFLNQYGCIIPVNGIAYYDPDNTDNVITPDCGGLFPSMVDSECRVKHDYCYLPMHWATNTFHLGYHANNFDHCVCSDLTYVVNNNYIFTSFKEGKVAMSYLAVPTDENNLPLIPDTQSCINYVTWYVALKIAFQMYIMDKYTRDKYEEFKGYANLYYIKAKNEAKLPASLDEWASLQNQIMRRIPDFYNHRNFYKNLYKPSETWIHPRVNAFGNVGTTGII